MKNVSCQCSRLVGNLPVEGLYWNYFIKVTGCYIESTVSINNILNHLIYFAGDIRKTVILKIQKVSENSLKSVKSSFLGIRAVHCTTFNENVTPIASRVQGLSQLLRSTCGGSLFNVVTKEIPEFYNTLRTQWRRLFLFQKVAFLETLKILLLTWVAV